MLKIGEFAGVTGLSVKALRHYDEKGVLIPVDVDERSGYRRYGEGQVRAGVTVRALRDAGVPLPHVAAAVATGAELGALRAHRQRVLEDREREDHAFEAADVVLRGLSVPVDVLERTMDAQPFVGRVISVEPEAAESLSDEDANAVFAELFMQLQASGLAPSGPFWTTLKTGDNGTMQLICCWPTPLELDADWGGPQTLVGVLPVRVELVATWRPTEEESLGEGSTHPAVVALFDALAERQLDLRVAEVRQSVLGQSKDDYAVEVSVAVGPR